MLSDEGLELSQRQTDTIFQGPSLDDQAEELIIGTIVRGCGSLIIDTMVRESVGLNCC